MENSIKSSSLRLETYLKNISENADYVSQEIVKRIEKNVIHNREEIQDSCMPLLLSMIEGSNATGVFIVFNSYDALTGIKEAIYLRDTEPDMIQYNYEDLQYLCGIKSLAKKYNIQITSKWKENTRIDKSNSYYMKPIEAWRKLNLLADSKEYESISYSSVTTCGYWSSDFEFPNIGNKSVSYTIPLIGTQGNCYGILGFEVSYDLLKTYTPISEPTNEEATFIIGTHRNRDNKEAKGINEEAKGINEETNEEAKGINEEKKEETKGINKKIKEDIYSSVIYNKDSDGILNRNTPISLVKKSKENVHTYEIKVEHNKWVGLYERLSIYQPNDYYKDDSWVLIGMVEADNFNRIGENIFLLFIITVGIIIIVSGICIFYMYRINTKKIIKIQQSIQSTDSYGEIFHEFISNVEFLTYTEKLIFNYYLEGKSASEVAVLMNISINTVKVHNKHIYTKLNITSKDELSLYANLLKKAGKLSLIK